MWYSRSRAGRGMKIFCRKLEKSGEERRAFVENRV
jgi:hypothetical protein